MRRGPKPELPSSKRKRGTFRADRDSGALEIVSSIALPQQPDWLTEAGKEIWLDEVGRVSSTGLATETDSAMFATYCNLQGACAEAWMTGEVPPASHLMEMRKLAEQFGLSGAKSRLIKGAQGGQAGGNPFARNGKRI